MLEFKIIVSEQEMRIIYQALGELPLKISGPVFTKLQEQVIDQSEAAKKEVK
jgi:hypothetical protein